MLVFFETILLKSHFARKAETCVYFTVHARSTLLHCQDITAIVAQVNDVALGPLVFGRGERGVQSLWAAEMPLVR